MASEESLMMINSSSIQDEDYENDNGIFHYYQTRQNSLSRLSICTSSFHDEDDDDVTNHQLVNFVSDLSLDDDVGAEADGENSDEDGDEEESESDKESPGFYSLPIISRRRRQVNNDGGSGSKGNLVKQRRVIREKRKRGNHYGHGFNGSDGNGNGNCGGGGGRGGELTVLTKVNGGGKKAMKMGFEEVIACRDLGFDLEIPGRVSVSTGSTRETQTSSGGNSPIATWRISSPGDDPREVKARLKMWAQAVALASASR